MKFLSGKIIFFFFRFFFLFPIHDTIMIHLSKQLVFFMFNWTNSSSLLFAMFFHETLLHCVVLHKLQKSHWNWQLSIDTFFSMNSKVNENLCSFMRYRVKYTWPPIYLPSNMKIVANCNHIMNMNSNFIELLSHPPQVLHRKPDAFEVSLLLNYHSHVQFNDEDSKTLGCWSAVFIIHQSWNYALLTCEMIRMMKINIFIYFHPIHIIFSFNKYSELI